MERARQQTRWQIALQHYHAAILADTARAYNASVANSYYAMYNAMWLAIGDPPGLYWRHDVIVPRFARGEWRTPPLPLERPARTIIHALHDVRGRSQYQAELMTWQESADAMMQAHFVLTLVAETCGFVLETYPDEQPPQPPA